MTQILTVEPFQGPHFTPSAAWVQHPIPPEMLSRWPCNGATSSSGWVCPPQATQSQDSLTNICTGLSLGHCQVDNINHPSYTLSFGCFWLSISQPHTPMPPTPIPQHCSASVGEPKAGLAFLCWPRVIKLASLFMRRNQGSSTASPSARNFPRHQPFLNVFQINCQGGDFFPRAEVVHSLGISWLSHPRAHLSSCHNSSFLHHGVTRGWAALLGLPFSPGNMPRITCTL